MFNLNMFSISSGQVEASDQGRSRRGIAPRAGGTPAAGVPLAPATAAAPGGGERTRELILGTALDLLRELGYEETTMRGIANRAGVSLGNAYYYFRSKEQLIQAFYAHSHQEHLAASRPIVEREYAEREYAAGC